jgi:asparagine synthase (glutamine-hydrolysing)
MSGIAGILGLDGQTVAGQELERAANALSAYGPDRSSSVVVGSLGLCNALMRTTPEDRFDRQPWRSRSGCWITADLRLDNRDDVLARIGLAPQAAADWPDSQVLLTAWEKFGDALWSSLRGAFAAAIWNPSDQTLTLARDHLGLHVVMWHCDSQYFTFASMPNGLFAFDHVRRELDEEKFADFLVLNHAEHLSTIYRGIFRVRPAHVLKVAADGSRNEIRYWSLAEGRRIVRRSDQAYADGLREVLDRAVRRQLRSAYPIGCLLSGGLDSASVFVLAARALAERGQRIAAFTGVPRNGFDGRVAPGCYADETPYVKAVANMTDNADVTFVSDRSRSFFADLVRCFIALQGPVRNPSNLGWILSILRTAQAQGRRVVLGGFAGNQTISWDGWSQTVGHLGRGRVLTALAQWNLYYRLTPYSRWQALRKLIVEPLLAERSNGTRDRNPAAAWQNHAAIRPDFAAAAGVNARAREVGHDFYYRLRADDRARGLTSVDYLGDWRAAEKALTGVEVRDPTADIDVISYCFGVPGEQYLAEGIDRSLIRRAMWDLLPREVLTNRLHGLQAADWYEKIDGARAEFAEQLTEIKGSSLARRMIDLSRLQDAIDDWPADRWDRPAVFEKYGLMLTRGLAAGRFLRWFESAND